jgi:hypothetical protein
MRITWLDRDCYAAEAESFPWEWDYTISRDEARALIRDVCDWFGVTTYPSLRISTSRFSWGGGCYNVGRAHINLHTAKDRVKICAHTTIHETCHHVSVALSMHDRHGPIFRALVEVADTHYAMLHNLSYMPVRGASEEVRQQFAHIIGESPYYTCQWCEFTVPNAQRAKHNAMWHEWLGQ